MTRAETASGVRELFERLEKSGLRYALLRNYEQLLDGNGAAGQATDIDLVIASGDIPAWRKLAASFAADDAWDVLTECKHFTQSSERVHHIEIFRFYRYAGRGYLQVDLFHAYLIWGVPFISETEILAGRIHDRARGVTRIDPVKENAFRLLQIHGLAGSQHSQAKVMRYRERVLRFDRENRAEFRDWLDQRMCGQASRMLAALESEDWKAFSRAVLRAKARYWLRSVGRHPWRAFQLAWARLEECRKRYLSNPCGLVLKLHAGGPGVRARCLAVLDELQKSNLIDEWSEEKAVGVLEQGGLIVQWTGRDRAGLIIEEHDDEEHIWRSIVEALIGRHEAVEA